MTKKDFNKAQKILKKHFPYLEFELSSEFSLKDSEGETVDVHLYKLEAINIK